MNELTEMYCMRLLRMNSHAVVSVSGVQVNMYTYLGNRSFSIFIHCLVGRSCSVNFAITLYSTLESFILLVYLHFDGETESKRMFKTCVGLQG